LRKAAEEAARLEPDATELDQVKPLLDVREPITEDHLPSWVRGWFVERDGRFGNLAVVFTDLSGSNVRDMEVLSARLEEWRRRFPGVRFASGVALLGEVVPSLRRDAPIILGLATLGLSLAVLLVRRSLRRLLLVLVPLVLSGAISMGLIVLFGVHINFYNLLVFPLAIGMGIDGSIYVTEAVLDSQSAGDLWTACRAVLGATLTTLAGFAALLLANNPGLVSLAHVALITMGSTLFINLIWLPVALGALKRRPAATSPQA
jgi:predicted RND superfamily exporter protein